MPDAIIPNYGAMLTLTAVANTPVPSNMAFRIAVVTAGNLMARYENSRSDVTLHYPAAGVFFEPGVFSQIWLPAVDAVELEPGNSIVLVDI